MLCTLFRIERPVPLSGKGDKDASLFQAMRVWTDIGDISERDSFDGHYKSIVEHTLNVLFLPGIHTNRQAPSIGHHEAATNDSRTYPSVSTRSSSPLQPSHPHPVPTQPGLPIPGTGLSLPSPLHLQLRIITRLSFNEQGRITQHRDFWDVKDVIGLIPGVSLAHWIAARLAARSLSLAARIFLGSDRNSGTRKTAVEVGPRSRSVSVGYERGAPGERLYEGRPEDLEIIRGPGRAEMGSAPGHGAYAKNVFAMQGRMFSRREL